MTDPDWMTPPKPASDTLGMESGPGINVKPDALKLFSDQTGKEATAYVTNFSGGVTKLSSAASEIGGTSTSAMAFHRNHGKAFAATSKFFSESSIGLTALQLASFSIAVNYLTADSTSGATLADIDVAFNPGYGPNTGSLAYGVDHPAPPSEADTNGQAPGVPLPPAQPGYGNPTTANAGAGSGAKTIQLGSGTNTLSYTINGDNEGISSTSDTDVQSQRTEHGNDKVDYKPEGADEDPTQVNADPNANPDVVPLDQQPPAASTEPTTSPTTRPSRMPMS